ncbi:MAG: ABC transporter ATP-binding protein [Candidatus Latescibacterota bacterium]
MLLELKDIKKEYVTPSGKNPLAILSGITLSVAPGEAIAVAGPSGSGKSTLLNIIGGLDRPTSGAVTFDGMNLAEMSETRLAQIRNTGIGFVFQLHHLLPQCTVWENVLIPTLPLGKKRNHGELKDRAEDLLRRVGLENHFDYFSTGADQQSETAPGGRTDRFARSGVGG